MDNFENEQNSFIVLNSLNVTSVGSSNHSLSSPSVIPPILEDASDSLSVFYSSSPPDHPPCIEASESLYDYTAEGHQQISNSSDCVVRLQAQPSVIKMSSIINPQEPGLKSWKVVTKTKQNDKRSKQKRLSGTFGKGHSKFKHKLKLIKRKLTSPMLCNFDFVDSVPCDVNGLSDINHDYRTSQTYPEGDPCIYGNQANIIASHQDGARLNCTPLCSAERTNVLKSKVNRRMTHPLGSSMLFRTHAFRESIHPNAYCSDETDSPTCENLSIEVSDTPSWFSGKIESSSSRSSYPVYAQQNIDSLDNQSCTTHLPSSTVSPSSLDLGSLPFPNPTQWTIDEVYTYITTRDTSLLEAAEKFKHHEIDGQALLLLSMESLRHYMKIKLGPALKMVHLINRLKRGLL
ncbi:unnamed protein product [Heterobilharzia americana]|nr:unnamed protein product [Heterobilharzia americana]